MDQEYEAGDISTLPNRLILSPYGTVNKTWALGVQGDKEHLRLTHNLLVNYGAISPYAKFHQWHERFGYFVIDWDRLVIALNEFHQNMYWMEDRGNRRPGDGKFLAIQRTRDFLRDIPREEFMRYPKSGSRLVEYSVGTINANVKRWAVNKSKIGDRHEN